MNNLQLAIDIGRVLAPTPHSKNADTMRAAAQKIVDVLDLSIVVDEDTSFLFGLGYGCADRHKVPREQAILEITGEEQSNP